ncbi:MAG: hypothetical protein ACFB21_00820 [Opitutales bacterium]
MSNPFLKIARKGRQKLAETVNPAQDSPPMALDRVSRTPFRRRRPDLFATFTYALLGTALLVQLALLGLLDLVF